MWKCDNCGAEFSSMMGDNEVSEKCSYCGELKIKEVKYNEKRNRKRI